MEALTKLPSRLQKGAAASPRVMHPQTSDGAAMVVVMSGEKASELGLKPIARFVSFAAAGVAPS